MRNPFDKALFNQANRVADRLGITDAELNTMEDVDLGYSR